MLALAGSVLSAGQRALADDYSDATLETFITVSIEVSRRIEAWRPRIERAIDADERDTLIEQAEADIASAIEDAAGIDEDEYHAIYKDARGDEALRARIARLLSARRQRRRTAHRGTTGR